MRFSTQKFPSIVQFLKLDSEDIEGEVALLVYEQHWEDIKNKVKGTEEEKLLKQLIIHFGAGVFSPDS